jgi:hypothetical protein
MLSKLFGKGQGQSEGERKGSMHEQQPLVPTQAEPIDIATPPQVCCNKNPGIGLDYAYVMCTSRP